MIFLKLKIKIILNRNLLKSPAKEKYLFKNRNPLLETFRQSSAKELGESLMENGEMERFFILKNVSEVLRTKFGFINT